MLDKLGRPSSDWFRVNPCPYCGELTLCDLEAYNLLSWVHMPLCSQHSDT